MLLSSEAIHFFITLPRLEGTSLGHRRNRTLVSRTSENNYKDRGVQATTSWTLTSNIQHEHELASHRRRRDDHLQENLCFATSHRLADRHHWSGGSDRIIAWHDGECSNICRRFRHSLHRRNPGEHVDLIFRKQITHSQQENHAAKGYGPPEATSLPHLIEHPTAPTRGTIREVPPSDPAAFDAWIVALFLQNVDISYQHPEWLYACKQAPRHIPPTGPAAFDAWITSFFTRSKVNRTHHRDAIRDELSNRIFVDTLSGGPSGSAIAMAGPSYPQPGIPWWIVPPGLPPKCHIPNPVVATTVPRWLSNGEPSVMFVSRAHTF
ncbi:hypothetical protein EV421DRAFT_1841376 [Armillaria borealis]|uniref:Uncharacterized protein n=1 Tax=Armillaria borealis TaxID=47425 RepID=A0AA39J498_9AGAR|nr:hypothetical protein EV421DRAFT_1841376 [Armillaria borealis]